MALTWSVCSILFLAVFGAKAFILEDDPLVDKVKAIIAKVDTYVSSHGFSDLNLPNIGTKPPVQLTNGGFRDFSSLYVQDATNVNQTTLSDGSTLYTFDIKVGLSEFVLHYDFDFSALVVKEKGNFSLSVQKNSADVTGSVVVQTNGTCEGKLISATVLVLGDFKITITPDNIPHVITEAILNLLSPLLIPTLNKEIKSVLPGSGLQNVFSTIACSELAQFYAM
ncbi:uncharacterized protein [Halyomorpha halys]|uniref:uncharacterized protein n=1 Tax=Halyomorpha halys TaxID=286706 RepID=UPI0006D51051|nr:uncharacterized protein LOC106685659 [Halyomorpha halys]